MISALEARIKMRANDLMATWSIGALIAGRRPTIMEWQKKFDQSLEVARHELALQSDGSKR